MKAYPDSSFLVSTYLPDTHSSVADRFMLEFGSSLVVSSFHELEVTNAIELAVFRRQINRQQARAARADFESDLSHWGVSPFPPDALTRATTLARRHSARYGTRSLDVLHVALALALSAEVFLTLDTRQRRLAWAQRLRVLP